MLLFQILSVTWDPTPGFLSQASSLLKSYLSPKESWGFTKTVSRKFSKLLGSKKDGAVILPMKDITKGKQPYLPFIQEDPRRYLVSGSSQFLHWGGRKWFPAKAERQLCPAWPRATAEGEVSPRTNLQMQERYLLACEHDWQEMMSCFN